MKKIIQTSMIFLLLLTFTSCTTKNAIIKNENAETTTINKSNSTDIKFEYFYRGFASMHDNEKDTYPGTLIIQTDADWHDFMDKYIPGIPYNTEIDFSKECLVFSSLFPAKPIYSISADVKTFNLIGNKLETEYIDYGQPNGIANGIYAQNIDNLIHCFVNIVKISKSDVPKGIENIYHKK